MICKKCRKEIPEVSVYCMWCGRKQVQAERIKRRANGTGSVYKMSGSRSRPWRAVATDHGKRITVGSYATQTEALKALAAYEPQGSVVRSDMTLEDVYEPYLMQLGFLTRTPRGRCVTALAYDHLHIPYDGQTAFDL